MTSHPSTVTFTVTRTIDLTQSHCFIIRPKKTDGCEGEILVLGAKVCFPSQAEREEQFMEMEGS